MFGLVKKLVGLGEDDAEDGASTRTDQPAGPPETKQYNAKVTSLHGNYGLIDGEIYFGVDVVRSGVMPKVNQYVRVTAHRNHGYGGWRANIVEIIDESDLDLDWDEEINDIQLDEPVGDLENENKIDSIVGEVADNPNPHGCIDSAKGFFRFDASSVEFAAQKGDYVTANLQKENETCDTCIAVNVKPLRLKEFQGRINSAQREYGYIDQEIYFVYDVCPTDYVPRRGDKVFGSAIECNRGKYSTPWRALSVEPLNNEKRAYNPLDSGSVVNNPVGMKSMRDLLDDKNDICIKQTSVDFGRIEIGKPRNADFSICNTGTAMHELISCKIVDTGNKSQFEIGAITVDGEDKKVKMDQKFTIVPVEPNKVVNVSVSCNARYIGNDQSLLVMEFESFKIGRQVYASVFEPSQHRLDPSNPFKRNAAFRRFQDDQQNDSWIVPGQKPERARANLKLPNRLDQYPIPGNLRDCVLNKNDVSTVAPHVEEPLSIDNYSHTFGTFLHLEEIQAEIEIRDFDMERVCMRQLGEYLSLTVPGLAEGRPSVLIGDRIIVSEPGLKGHVPSHEGYVHEVRNNDVLLKFHPDFHCTFSGQDYDIEFTFNRTTYRRCHQAAKLASKIGNAVLFPTSFVPKIAQINSPKGPKHMPVAVMSKASPVAGIRKCPLGTKSKTPSESIKLHNEKLNARQRAAVFRIINGQSRPTPYVLFGPPGTGKTVTLVEAILQVFCKLPASRVVACTPSNSAADLLTERLHLSGQVKHSDLVRLNAFQRGKENIPKCIEPYCFDGDDLNSVIRYRILVCTCSSAGMLYALNLKPGHYTHAFIDEAGQATEPECMIPIGLVAPFDGQVVLAGDPLQLGPVLRSTLAKQYGLELSYLERLTLTPIYKRNEDKFADHGCYDPLLVTKLVENYRSHPTLLELPSQRFYDNELSVSADKSTVDCFCEWKVLPRPEFPLIFHGVRGDDMREENSPSWFNPQEVFQVSAYLKQIMENDVHQMTYDDVGIIAPYRKQVEKIRFMIDKYGMEKVKVGSVEEFQGQERLVMVISTVRSNEEMIGQDIRHNLGFLSNSKRFNVSITRAQALLIVIGNPYVLCQDEDWLALIQYSIKNKTYVGCEPPVITSTSTSGSEVTEGEVGQSEEELVTPSPDMSPDAVTESVSEQVSEDSYTLFTRHNLSTVGEMSEDSMTDKSASLNYDHSWSVIQETSLHNLKETQLMKSKETPVAALRRKISDDSDGRDSEEEASLSDSYYSDDDCGSPRTPNRNQPVSEAIDPNELSPSVDSVESDIVNANCDYSGGETQSNFNITPSNDAHTLSDTGDVVCSLKSGPNSDDSIEYIQSPTRSYKDAEPNSAHIHVPQDSNNVSLELADILPVTNANYSSYTQEVYEGEHVSEESESGTAESSESATTPNVEDAVCSLQKPHRQWFLSSDWKIEPTEIITKALARSRANYEVYKKCRRPSVRWKDKRAAKTSTAEQPGSVGTHGESIENRNQRRQGAATNTSNVEARIIRQLEYYFGDLNLMKDDFLKKEIAKDPDNWVPLSVLVTFKRLQSITTDFSVIVQAIKKSTTGLLQTHQDGQKLRRSPSRPLVTDHEIWKQQLASRSIALSMVSLRENIDMIQSVCTHYGDVEHIEKEIWCEDNSKRCLTLVVFSSSASVDRAARYSTVYRRRWRIHADKQFVEECVEYFYDKRVMSLQRSHIVPVGRRRVSSDAIQTPESSIKTPAQTAAKHHGGHIDGEQAQGVKEDKKSDGSYHVSQQATRDSPRTTSCSPVSQGQPHHVTSPRSSPYPSDAINPHQPVQHERKYKVNLWMAAHQKPANTSEKNTPSSGRKPMGRAAFLQSLCQNSPTVGAGGRGYDQSPGSRSNRNTADSTDTPSYSSFVETDSDSLGVSALSPPSVFEDSPAETNTGAPHHTSPRILYAKCPNPVSDHIAHSTPTDDQPACEWNAPIEPGSESCENRSHSLSNLDQYDDDVIVESSEEELLE